MAILVSDFLAQELAVEPYLIGHSVLPVKGKCIIGGAPKSNKTFIALGMALSLAKGEHVWSACYDSGTPVLPVSKPCRVLYFDQEIGDLGLQERLGGKEGKPGLFEGENIADLSFWVKTRDFGLRMDTDEGREQIWREVDSVKPDVVFLDPMAKFHLSDENSSQEMGAVCRASDHLIEKFGCAVVWIHHLGKQSTENPRRGGDLLRGSSALYADVDTLLIVEQTSSETSPQPILKLSFTLRRGEPLRNLYVRRLTDGRIQKLPDDFRIGGDSSELKLPRGKNRFANL